MSDRSLIEKIAIFISCLFLPFLCLCLILDMYSNYEVHRLYKFYPSGKVLHDYCVRLENKFVCFDNYYIPE